MIDLGIIQRYLGVNFEKISKKIFIHQKKYAKYILKQFRILDYKFANKLLPKGLVLANINSILSDAIIFYQSI